MEIAVLGEEGHREDEAFIGELLDWNLTAEQAGRMVVRHGGVRKTLEELAMADPAALDDLLDQLEPGNLLFYAVVLVNEKYEWEVSEAVNKRNEGIKLTIAAKMAWRPCLSPSALHALHLDGCHATTNQHIQRPIPVFI